MSTIATFMSGAFAGVLVGGFIGCLAMACIKASKSSDLGAGTGTEARFGDEVGV